MVNYDANRAWIRCGALSDPYHLMVSGKYLLEEN
jgi:hypothetical protein